MSILPPQHYQNLGRKLGIPEAVLTAAGAVIRRIRTQHPSRAVVFTLAHLALEAGVPYKALRKVVGRRGNNPYREYFLAKKPVPANKSPQRRRARRRIAIPDSFLKKQQRWIVQRILHTATPHEASVAFHRKSDVVEVARIHCQCRWLIKLDVENFFESIYEPNIYKVFLDLGYPKLLAFEMTRLCTRVVPKDPNADTNRATRRWAERGPDAYLPGGSDAVWRVESPSLPGHRVDGVFPEIELRLGSLPQGAPTSPLLANLAVRGLDDAISAIASSHGLIYTRYADDIALSTNRTDFDRSEASAVIGKIARAMDMEGLRPHRTKTRIIPPGARKIVLGLVVDGAAPRLTREYRNKLRLHAHMLESVPELMTLARCGG